MCVLQKKVLKFGGGASVVGLGQIKFRSYKMRTSRWTLLNMWCFEFELCNTNVHSVVVSKKFVPGNFEIRFGQVLPQWLHCLLCGRLFGLVTDH